MNPGTLRWAALLAALAVVWSVAAAPAGAAAPGYRTRSQFVDVVDGPGNDQHLAIDTTLYLPAGASAARPVPAIIGAHGFGESKQALAGVAEFLARRGYAVLLYSARGFGRSGGLISLDSPDYDVKDVEQLVTWLGTQPEVERDAAGPVVGMFGESYGGATALLAAAYDPRIRVIAPILTWNSLIGSFLPNDVAPNDPRPGVFKQAWASVFLGGIGASLARGFAGGAAGVGAGPPASPCPTFIPAVCQAYVATAETGVAPPSALALMAASSPASVMARIKVPTLLIQGESDTLFDLDQAEANDAGVTANGAPARMVWIPGGHSDLAGILSGTTASYLEAAISQWFDRWLKDDTAVSTGPARVWYDATTKRYLALGGPGAPARWYLSAGGSLVGGPGSVRPGFAGFANPPGGLPAALSFDPTGSALSTLPAYDIPGQNASFTSAPLASPIQVVGSPAVRLTVSSSTPDLELFVKLYDVAGNATATLPGGQVAPVRLTGLTPGVSQTVGVILPAVAQRFAAGDRIRLVVAATDSAYANLPAASVYRLTIDRAGTAALVLPEVPVPPAGSHTAAYAVVAVVVVAASAVIVLTRRRPAAAPAAAAQVGGTPVAVAMAGLSKRFRRGFLAVDDLSLSIGTGQVFGLLGPNGAGKTTTIRMLLGLVYPTAGSCAIFGETIRPGHPVLARVGTLVEGPRFVPHLSGLDNLELFWRAGGQPWSEAHGEAALAVADLGDAVDRPVKTYSQGMRQRLGIAQALLGRPDLLILDEPTNGLDPQQMYEMRQVIRRLAGQGMTILLSSHLLAEVEQVCTHAAIMDRGRLVATGTVAELIGGSPTVYLEVEDTEAAIRVLEGIAGADGVRREGPGLVVELNGARPAAVASALVAAGAGLVAMTPRRHLEEVFLGLIEDERSHAGYGQQAPAGSEG